MRPDFLAKPISRPLHYSITIASLVVLFIQRLLLDALSTPKSTMSKFLLATCSLSLSGFALGESGFGYNYFSRTNTKNVTLPSTREEAELMGWHLAKREDGTGVCREGLGVEYTEDADTHSKARPLSLFFEDSSSPQAKVSAFSIRAWFSNASFYNPDTWMRPPFGVLEDEEGTDERMVTISTRDPKSVCGQEFKRGNELLGDRLIVNVNPAGDGLAIPTTVPSTLDGPWISGACQADMSRHWGYPLNGDAKELYGFDHGVHVLPVIPMYSVPEGDGASVTALAFFTTEPQVTYGNGGIWDATGTAAQLCSGNFCLDENLCEYGEGNSVLHGKRQSFTRNYCIYLFLW